LNQTPAHCHLTSCTSTCAFTPLRHPGYCASCNDAFCQEKLLRERNERGEAHREVAHPRARCMEEWKQMTTRMLTGV